MKFFDLLERIIISFTAVILSVLSILVCYQVFSRYIFNASPFWIEEMSTVLLMWVGLLGAAGCVWHDSHMSLELVVSKLPESIRIWQKLLVDLIVAVFAVFLLQQGIVLVSNTMNGTMSSINIPLGITYLVMPVSAAIILLFSIIKAVKRVFTFINNKGGHAGVK